MPLFEILVLIVLVLFLVVQTYLFISKRRGKTTKMIHLEMTEETYNKIEELTSLKGIETGELVRRALSLYAFATTETIIGELRLCTVDCQGKVVEEISIDPD